MFIFQFVQHVIIVEQKIRTKLMMEARTNCLEESRVFGECSKAAGLMVVFKCRAENKASKYLETMVILLISISE